MDTINNKKYISMQARKEASRRLHEKRRERKISELRNTLVRITTPKHIEIKFVLDAKENKKNWLKRL